MKRTEGTTRNRVLTIALVLALSLALFGAAQAMVTFYKVVAGIGNVDYVDEARVTNVIVQSNTKVRVDVQSQAGVTVGYAYTVTLMDNGTTIGTTTTTFAASGITNKITFNGLALGATTTINVEVTK